MAWPIPPVNPTANRCAGWPVEGRREFLHSATALVAGALAGLGASPDRAAALTVRWTSALRVLGDQVSYPIPAADGATIDQEQQVILVRYRAAVYAFALSCPHQNVALKWLERDQRFQCPKHKSKYQPDGTFMSGRATRGMDRFRVRRDGNTIVVDLGTLYREDEDKAGWTSAMASLA